MRDRRDDRKGSPMERQDQTPALAEAAHDAYVASQASGRGHFDQPRRRPALYRVSCCGRAVHDPSHKCDWIDAELLCRSCHSPGLRYAAVGDRRRALTRRNRINHSPALLWPTTDGQLSALRTKIAPSDN